MEKKRKVDTECRAFNEEWTWKYFFMAHNQKPMCLLCQETVAVVKEYNLARHFNTKHQESKYFLMADEDKKMLSKELKRNFALQQNFFKNQKSVQQSSTLAGHIVAYKIAKSNKPFSEGEFIKDVLISVGQVLCPEKVKDFESIGLSRRTVTKRIEAISSNLSNQLSGYIKNFKYFSITMDESVDRSDTAQLLVFIRGVDENFHIIEELAFLRSLKGKTTGKIIFEEFMEGIKSIDAPINKLISITTDGAPNMVGKNTGFAGIYRNQTSECETIFLHCIIHQDVLCKAALDIENVLNVVMKLINTIRARGLLHRQFQDFLSDVDAEFSDVLFHTKIRWLSCGNAFSRVWSLFEEIKFFLKTKVEIWSEWQILEDRDWCIEFAFFTDLLEHYNKLNKKLQGRNQFIDETWGSLRSFKTQLFIFSKCFEKNDLTHFPRLNSLRPVNVEKLKFFSESLLALHSEFEARFADFKKIQPCLDIFSMPFNICPENVPSNLQLELIDLQCNNSLKQLFLNTDKLSFYKSLPKDEFPNLINHAQKIMAMFASSYLCEQAFSIMKCRKNSIRNRLSDESLFYLLKVASSQLEPDFEEIISSQKQLHASHTSGKS
jgi:hypothetical protein